MQRLVGLVEKGENMIECNLENIQIGEYAHMGGTVVKRIDQNVYKIGCLRQEFTIESASQWLTENGDHSYETETNRNRYA